MTTLPERIGKYAISEVLGQGAMGVVYKGFDPHIHRPVAIKVVHKQLLGDDAARDSIGARFRNEAQAVGRIAHPGVVAIYEFGEDAETAYIAMEYVPGRNLDQVLAGTPLLEEAQLLRVMDQLLAALEVAHAHGVLHRDIKPANLLLTAGGQVKLTDFGIARIENAGLTQVASTIGTPGYMAPEQYVGDGIDHRADLFACGVLLFRLLVGRAPFVGPPEVVMYKILNEDAPAPSVASDGRRPAAYDAVVARAMAKLPEQRYASAQAMRQALLEIAGGASLPAGRTAADSDATVIVPPGNWARAVEAAMQAPGRPPVASSTAADRPSAIAPGAWDPQELSRIERALASHIGPMARLMVRQAAGRCSDVGSLASAVSTHIPEAAQRERFMHLATSGTASPTGIGTVHATSQGTAYTPADAAAIALTDDFKARALQVMVRRMGPIARVIVKRAGDESRHDRGRFLQLLVQGASDSEREALRRDLSALD